MSRKHRRARDIIEDDLDLLPFMGLFVVLIPMLLLSAVFLQISVIDLALPEDGDSAAEESTPFLVTVAILDASFVVKAEGAPARVIPRTGDNPMGRLASELASAAAVRPRHRSVTILSEPTTRYEDIIAVMDASREAGLPDVSLSGASS